jgi:hypothetical protein
MDNPILIAVVLAVAALMGVGAYLFLRPRAPQEEEVYHFSCPKCRRRFGYRAAQAGRPGSCPRCKQLFTFPAVHRK